MAQTTSLFNRDWMFSNRDNAEYAKPGSRERGFVHVNLPHSNAELPLNYFSEKRTQFVSWYRKHFSTPSLSGGKRVFLDFDGVMMSAEVYINGRLALRHRGGYVGFTVDATPFLREKRGADNVVAVRVDSRLQRGIPPCGRVMDFQTFGGIYRDVHMRVTPACFVSDVFVRTPKPLQSRKTVFAEFSINNTGGSAFDGTVRLDLLSLDGKKIASGPETAVRISSNSEAEETVEWRGLTGLKLWELDSPQRYVLEVTLLRGKRTVDRMDTCFGFREAKFTKKGPFMLNGRSVKLIGQNRHQNYAYIGAAAPARLQRRDADIIKFDLGCNLVRTSHYPQSPHFLERCDEIGLLVFEEAPGWGYIGGAGWKNLFCRDVEAMICRDRNHPSIILWGIRVNESADDHDFYTRTNALSRKLDPSRPTGGVRWGIDSEFLEDVFTTNDYSYKPSEQIINDPPVTPYLITEYGGCMVNVRHESPCEVHAKYAIMHANIVNAVMGHKKIAGAIAWCSFDYHSQDWLSSDGIQPWGLLDIFRAPKLSAALYASQVSPRVRPVLKAITRWKVGDQAGFDPYENTMKKGHDSPMIVFSNCERIQVKVGNKLKGTFMPARERFPNLDHPPFLCSGLGALWGPAWKDLQVTGFVGKRAVIDQKIPASHEATNLDLVVDDTELTPDGSDMTRVLLRHTDAFGNQQPHSSVAVNLKLSGPATLIGPNPCALVGGVCGFYLRAGTRPGLVKLTAHAPVLGESQSVVVRVKRMK